MKSLEELGQRLWQLDGRSYRSYKQITGEYAGSGFVLCIDHVQGDPFAEPSRVRLFVDADRAGFPEWVLSSPTRRRAAADFVNRRFYLEVQQVAERSGSGKSGAIEVLRPGQQVLERTSLSITPDGAVEARLKTGLPARGRSVLGKAAQRLLVEHMAELVERALVSDALELDALKRHLEMVEDSQALRGQLVEENLVAFIPNGAILPRRSGVDDRPARGEGIVPFQSPPELEIELTTPNGGPISGMGIPTGITLIVGGGYHGKSTVLRAVELGVYDHIPGDGRERVVTVDSAVKVRAEDGRSIPGIDISNFIDGLPGGQDTRHFQSENASGSTSQAAGIVEALEVGCGCLLLDEDTCATNFMIRDARMQRLVAEENEPITPFIDRALHLSADAGVSTVIVVGGAGDYFDVADCVIGMQGYRPKDLTHQAREISRDLPSVRSSVSRAWSPVAARRPRLGSLVSENSRKDGKVRTRDVDKMQFGDQYLELGAVEQLVEVAQLRGIAQGILWARDDLRQRPESMASLFAQVMERVKSEGLGSVLRRPTGDCAEFRVAELAAVLGRIRSLKTESSSHLE